MATETSTGGSLRRPVTRRWAGAHPDVLVPAALMLLAAAIRLPTLSLQSFWLDEAYTVRLVRMSLGGMLSTIPRTESTPPLYYVTAWLWTHVFGVSELGLRSLSAVAGIAIVPVVYAAGRRLGGPRAGAPAALLIAVSPLAVWFSQEARAYALATLLSAVTLLCVVGWLQERRRRWLTGWAVAAALGLLTHYFVGFVIAPELALLWWRRPPGRGGARRRLAAATALVAVVGLALVPLALAQRGTGHADYIAQGSLATRVLQVPKQLLIGYASPAQLATGPAIAALLAAGVGWPLLRGRAVRRRAALPLAVGLAAIVVPVLLALIGIDFLDTRNLLPALPALCVVAGVGFAAGADRRRIAAALAVAAISLATVVMVDADPAYQRTDWRGAAQALGPARGSRAVVVSSGVALVPLQAYLPRLRDLITPVPVREIDVIAVPSARPGAGLGIPPRPTAPLAMPPGFRLIQSLEGRTFTELRYRSATPVAVGAANLGADRLTGGAYATLVQTSAPRR